MNKQKQKSHIFDDLPNTSQTTSNLSLKAPALHKVNLKEIQAKNGNGKVFIQTIVLEIVPHDSYLFTPSIACMM
uniref:Uncharacterized protein n=1 Tax=Cucumis melo TaxID=3656 RepID=A0A9I9E4B1_CUCME